MNYNIALYKKKLDEILVGIVSGKASIWDISKRLSELWDFIQTAGDIDKEDFPLAELEKPLKYLIDLVDARASDLDTIAPPEGWDKIRFLGVKLQFEGLLFRLMKEHFLKKDKE